MNAIELLEGQHDQLQAMLRELKASVVGTQRNITFKKLKHSMFAHMVIEEEVFYPLVAKASSEGKPIAASYEEHSAVRMALSRCLRVLQRDELFRVRIGFLEGLVGLHLVEERQTILPRAREVLTQDELVTLGDAMKSMFDIALRSMTVSVELDLHSTTRELVALGEQQSAIHQNERSSKTE